MCAFCNARSGTKERALGKIQQLVGGGGGGIHAGSEVVRVVGVKEREEDENLSLPLSSYIHLY